MDDVINTGNGNDVISSGSGDDTINSGNGNDLIISGSGDDTVNAGDGNDIVLAGSGDDTVDGGTGNDIIEGGSGNDTLSGGDGNDILDGSSGADILNGDAGDDIIFGGSGNDIFIHNVTQNMDINNSTFDFYDGGSGIDKLRLIVTNHQLADLQAAITAFNASNKNVIFDFQLYVPYLDLKVVRIENLEIQILNSAPVAQNMTVSGNEDNHIFGQLVATDADPGSSLTYTLENGPTHGAVLINANGSFDYNPIADFFGADSFTFRVTDSQGAFDIKTVTLNVAAVNDAPVLATPITDVVIPEEGVIDINLSGVFTDVDSTLTLSMVGAPAWLTLDADNHIRGTAPLDFNGGFDITVTASDGSLSASDVFHLEVSPVNDAPEVLVANAITVLDENLVAAFIADVAVTDVDSLPSVTISDNRFEIVSGHLMLKAGESLDFETDADMNGNFTVTVTADDGMAPPVVQTITFALNDVNENVNMAPTISIDTQLVVSWAENLRPVGDTVIASLNVNDPNGDPLSFMLSDARFAVMATATPGEYNLVLKGGEYLDYELDHQGGLFTVGVTVSDGLESVHQDVSFTLGNVSNAALNTRLSGFLPVLYTTPQPTYALLGYEEAVNSTSNAINTISINGFGSVLDLVKHVRINGGDDSLLAADPNNNTRVYTVDDQGNPLEGVIFNPADILNGTGGLLGSSITFLNSSSLTNFTVAYLGTNGDDARFGYQYTSPGTVMFTTPVFLAGLDGNDKLAGSTGNDILMGGDGADVLVGGKGNDIFVGGSNVTAIEYSLIAGTIGDVINQLLAKVAGLIPDAVTFEDGLPTGDVIVGKGSTVVFGYLSTDFDVSIYDNPVSEYSFLYYYSDQSAGGVGSINITHHGHDAEGVDNIMAVLTDNNAGVGVTVSSIDQVIFAGDTYNLKLWDFETNDGGFSSLLTGTASADILVGAKNGALTDVTINGLGGNDHLYGLDGQSLLDGGLGNDVLIGDFDPREMVPDATDLDGDLNILELVSILDSPLHPNAQDTFKFVMNDLGGGSIQGFGNDIIKDWNQGGVNDALEFHVPAGVPLTGGTDVEKIASISHVTDDGHGNAMLIFDVGTPSSIVFEGVSSTGITEIDQFVAANQVTIV